MLDESYYRKTDEIISRYVREARSLIPIMQDIQAEYRYLPPELLSYVAKEIGITEKGLAVLTEEEKTVLYKFFINRPRRHIEDLCESLNYEKTRIYEIKETALRKFTLSCYGIVEL